jgi:hypothetical protein
MKQTAVEWLEKELKGVYESDYFNRLLKQAKEMEEIDLHLEYMKGWRDEYNNKQSVTDDTL